MPLYHFTRTLLLHLDLSNRSGLFGNRRCFHQYSCFRSQKLKHKNANDDKLMNIKMDLAKELIRRKLSKKKHNSIMSFLKYYVRRSTAVGINE